MGVLLKINDVDIRDPTSYEWQFMDVSSEDSGMSEDYKNIKDIQKSFRKLVCSWTNLSFSDASAILKAIRPPLNSKNPYIKLWYLDAEAGAWIEKWFTCGDRSLPLEMNAKNRWDSLSVNFIERDGE